MNRRDILRWTAYTAGISSLPISLSLIQSCQPSANIDWQPTTLSGEEAKILENIAEIILPSDPDMPGANELHCAEFVDKLVTDCLSSDDRKKFLRGLSEIEADYKNSTNKALSGAASDAMVTYIAQLDKSAFSENPNMMEKSYQQIKQMVLLGYFTSEMVMTKHLNYHAIPGEYKGCIDISEQDKAYVDNNVAG